MKNFLILLSLSFICANAVFAQEIKFKKFNENYSYLTEADLITRSIKWRDDQSLSSTIPFVFKFGDIKSEFLNIHTNGYCSFYDSVSDKSLTVFAFWLQNLIDRSYITGSTNPQSMISYKTATINNEIVGILEFKNAGFEYGGLNDSLNFQVWAFESGNKVQIRFGKSHVQNWQPILNVDSPAVCILVENENSELGGCLNGTSSNPIFDTVSGRITSVPMDGTVFELTYLTTHLNTIKRVDDFSYYVLDDKIHIKMNNEISIYELQLIDLMGREIVSSKNGPIHINSINEGIYFLRVINEKGMLTKRIKI